MASTETAGAKADSKAKAAPDLSKEYALNEPKGDEVGAQVQGIWDFERKLGSTYLPLSGKLLEARVFEGNYGPSVLWVFRTTSRCAVLDDEQGKDASLPADSIVGVYGSGGLKSLKNLGGCIIWLQYQGEIKVKRGTMKSFKIKPTGERSPVVVVDNRAQEREDGAEGDGWLPF